MSVRVRYAPSPTGSPHVGNIRTAIFNWLFARTHGGAFIARLEDTDRDPARYRPDSISDIEDSLRHLGIVPDEWWVSGGPAAPYIQSDRLQSYRDAAERLIVDGHAYRCFCTPERLAAMRAEQQERGDPSGYDRRCRRLSSGESERCHTDGVPYTVRLAVPLDGHTAFHDLVYGDLSFENRLIDDQVLLKSNGWPTYHLAVVVDDHAMAITHVLRGEDWLPSTPKQILLWQMFGWEQPAWAHLPLIVGTDKKKLSKRHGATQYVEFIREGYLPEALFNFLVLLGWSPGEENRELFSKEEILARFTIDGITNHPAVFDYEKLRWMNGHYIRELAQRDPERLTDLLVPYLAAEAYVSDPPSPDERAYVGRIVPLIAERMKLLADAPRLCDFFFREPTEPDEKGRRKWLTGPDAMRRIDAAVAEFATIGSDLTPACAEAATDRIAKCLGADRAPVIHTLRVAITGRTIGPGLFELIAVFGRDVAIRRLENARRWVVSD